jgi:curved DNA-binding protein CbpA
MFTDYYEILEISPNANSDTIQRVFRHIAKRCHPDNPDTGDSLRFSEVMKAYDTLKDPVSRARYDIEHNNHSGLRTKLAEEVSNAKGIERDAVIQDKMLSILYVKRRQDMDRPGIGAFELARLLDCPPEHLEFHLWYLKAKTWIRKEEDGMLAITVEGVDFCNSKRHREAGAPQLRIVNTEAEDPARDRG